MIIWGVIILVVSGALWYLAGFSSNGQPILGPIYGSTWQTIFLVTGLIGLILIVVGLFTKKKSAPSETPPPAPPSPPAEKSE